MIPTSIRSDLQQRGVPYREVSHAYQVTAQETAAAAHVSGKRFAKTVVLKQGDHFILAVLPAHEQVDLARWGRALGEPVALAEEEEFAGLFPDCEPGAQPPLGHLYGLPVAADECLAERRTIDFNGGTHTDVIEMRWADFAALERPRVVRHGAAPARS